MTLDFARPWALAMLLLLMLGGWLLARRARAAVPHPRSYLLPAPSVLVRLLGAAPELLRALSLAALIIAIAGPRLRTGERIVRGEGIPIAIAIDISSSMLAQDMGAGNRLDAARETVSRFVRQRPGDPVALVAFAGEAITQVPLTLDDAVLLGALGNLRVGLLEDGTAIGDGLALAAARLRTAPGESRVAILMSDGASNRGEIEPLAAARAAQALGIQVFTIGLGTRGDAPIPLPESAGGGIAEVAASVDEPLLREIARLTGGRFFRATDAAALRGIYDRIDRLVPAPVESRVSARYRELWPLLAVAAAVLLTAELALRASPWGRVP